MPQRIGSSNGPCECWAPVLGTMLILFGVFDLGFGAVMAALSISLGEIAGDVEANSGLIHMGSIFSKLTGGFVHLGNVDQGEAATAVLGMLPPVWLSLLLAIGRMLLALSSIALGVGLARRLRGSLNPLMVWAITACGWGIVSILANIGTYEFLAAASGGLAATVTVLADLGLHVAWPLVIGWKVWIARLS